MDSAVKSFMVNVFGEHITISPLMKMIVRGYCLSDHLLFCSTSKFFSSFSKLTRTKRKIIFGLKHNLAIMISNASLNRRVRPAPLHLFDKIKLRLPFSGGDHFSVSFTDYSNEAFNCYIINFY